MVSLKSDFPSHIDASRQSTPASYGLHIFAQPAKVLFLTDDVRIETFVTLYQDAILASLPVNQNQKPKFKLGYWIKGRLMKIDIDRKRNVF